MKDLFGWDAKKQKGSKGIFGTLDAYAVAHEEQGRKTLHGHWLIWVEDFKRLRQLLFHADKQKQKAAQDEYTKYIDDVMCFL